MNNHSDIWKNITMIIFYIILLLLLFLLFIKLKLNIHLEIKGIKTFVNIKFLFFEIKRKGSFILKKKPNNHESKDSYNEDTAKTKNKNVVRKKFSSKKILDKIIRKKKNKFILNFFIKHIREIKFDVLEIYEEIGILEPSYTAYATPVVLTITLFPLNLLNINYSNFKYDVIPRYSELKFNLILKSEVSFSFINIFISIITKKLHKLNILNKLNNYLVRRFS